MFSFPFEAMASQCEIKIAGDDLASSQALAKLAIDEVKRIEFKYSRYRADSIVAHINQAAGKSWIECDTETVALLDYADTLFAQSDGLFDITSGVLRKAWDFRRAVIPTSSALAPLLALIGWHRVERTSSRIRLPQAGMELDFGGFGKEYAADRSAAILQERGIQNGLVNLGGDLRILGPRPDGEAWLIGIQDPRDATKMIASLAVSRGALATSGDYERYFVADGRRYCHILNPSSGMPVEHWRSISVLAPLAIVAGSHATIAMLKQAEALPYLESAEVSYLAIDSAGRLHRKNADLH